MECLVFTGNLLNILYGIYTLVPKISQGPVILCLCYMRKTSLCCQLSINMRNTSTKINLTWRSGGSRCLGTVVRLVSRRHCMVQQMYSAHVQKAVKPEEDLPFPKTHRSPSWLPFLMAPLFSSATQGPQFNT